MVAILRSDHLPYTVQRDELNKLAFKILSANQPAQQQSPRAISPVRHPAPDYEGDYGDTFVFGDDLVHQRCARAARASTAATNWRKPDSHPERVCGYWRSNCVTMSVRSGLSLRTFRCGGSK